MKNFNFSNKSDFPDFSKYGKNKKSEIFLKCKIFPIFPREIKRKNVIFVSMCNGIFIFLILVSKLFFGYVSIFNFRFFFKKTCGVRFDF